METQHGFAEINGTSLYYEVNGSGRPLVFIHGATGDVRHWDDQFEIFAQHYQVIRYDQRGFGKSAVPTAESYAHTDDLKALLEHLGIEHARILGLSGGGGVAINFALSYPEATDALIPVDSVLGGYQWQEFGASMVSVVSAARGSGIDAARELWLGLSLFAPAMEKPEVASHFTQIVSDYSGWHWVNQNPARTLDPAAIQRLDEISAPTLVIIGERDLSDFHAIADTLQQQIPGAKKVILTGVGHLSNMEDPKKFNEVVLDFLASI